MEEHQAIAPLSFLLGRWEGSGAGGYPTIESFRFGQELTFTHIGKPYLIYTSRSWRLDQDDNKLEPLATETGFWRAQPDNKVEVLLAHPTGVTEIYLGEVSGNRIDLATDVVARTETAKPVTAGKRLYGLIGEDLGYAYDMAAVGQPLLPHLSAQLKKLKPPGDSALRGTGWTRPVSPGVRCMPEISPPPPRGAGPVSGPIGGRGG
jgi:hypothetical protein